jgi:hypothetical protein
MGTFKNEFSWSVSRDSIFRECPRKYYFNYYGSWSGWEIEAPERARKLYVLKNLKNRSTWIGEVVHKCIAHSLKNVSLGIDVLDLDRILEITLDGMRQDFRNSRDGKYWEDPKSFCGLFEHEYGIATSDEEWKAAADQAATCIRNFYDSDVFEELRKLPAESFLEVEEFSSFELEGVKVLLKLDCACRADEGIVVWDWKTGKSSSAGFPLQMACYAWYAGDAYGADPSTIITRRFDLFRSQVTEKTFTRKSFGELFSYIRGSIDDMRSLLEDPARNIAVEERFTKIERESVCRRCNFLKVCEPRL